MIGESRRLGGWLTLLIIVTGPLQVQTFKIAGDLEQIWQPHFGKFPQLQGAVVAEQAALGVSAALWIATAWFLYKRERGSLGKIIKLFISGGGLRIISPLLIPILGASASDLRSRDTEQHAAIYGRSVRDFMLVYVPAAIHQSSGIVWRIGIVRNCLEAVARKGERRQFVGLKARSMKARDEAQA